jgi:proteic killer suppression protein
VIQSFKGGFALELFMGNRPKKGFPADLASVARRKLLMLHAAVELADLRIPPNNKLEALAGDRKGQHNIRINDQWRVCFVWNGGAARDVEIVDYH